jgi:hypothetical protein
MFYEMVFFKKHNKTCTIQKINSLYPTAWSFDFKAGHACLMIAQRMMQVWDQYIFKISV